MYFSCDIGTGKEGLKKYVSDVVVIRGTSIWMLNRGMKVVKSIRADLGRGPLNPVAESLKQLGGLGSAVPPETVRCLIF